MKSLNDNKGIIAAIIIFVAAIGIYKYFFAGPADVVDTSGQAAGQDVVELNSRLQTVTLDQTVFTSPGYKALIDFSTPIDPQPQGRPNPFDPI